MQDLLNSKKINTKNNPAPKRAIALGFFDGVHLGHSMLLKRTAEAAAERNLIPTVFTFDTHPINEITGHPQLLLNTVSDRAFIMRKYYGISEVIFAHFDYTLMHMPWQDFIREMLVKQFGADYLVAGYDYHFGYKGEGNPERLKQESALLGIGCDIIPEVVLEGITVSSTYIRTLVAQGDMERAALFLGHPHILSGVVDHGRRLGRTIGLPTVNMKIPPEIQEPSKGVYATRVIIDETGKVYPGVTNIGVKPTVSNDGEMVVETHIIDFSGDLYGKLVRLEFMKFIRPETKFRNISDLKDQIGRDIEAVKAHF
jgi:riboflavin kinase/FMN adenylyltransferase